MPRSNPITVLVAPLNWGLGHVSRCIPLITGLQALGTKVLLASDGVALELLKAEFPHLPTFTLPSYKIRYPSHNMVWNIAWQTPRMIYAIRSEQSAVKRLVREHRISGIISDNRYGCFSPEVQSVLLTHQIHLRIPNAALQWTANRLLQRAFQSFNAIWIPDMAGEPNLSGALSHPQPPKMETQYLGLLSRFEAKKPASSVQNPISKVAVVLSGPEPQRTYLEQILMEQALDLPYQFVFVQGKTWHKSHSRVGENLELISYLTTIELNQLLASSHVVVCRAGYSSLMDLSVLGGIKAILIPTPGQTEQEYLANFFSAEGRVICQKQDEIDLKSGLMAVQKTTGFPESTYEREVYKTVLEDWLGKL